MFNNLKKVKNDKLKISALNLKTRVSHKFVSFRNVCKRNLHAVGQWLRTAVVPQIPRVAAVAIMLICMTICAYADEKAGAGQIEGVGQTFKSSYMPAVKTLMNGIRTAVNDVESRITLHDHKCSAAFVVVQFPVDDVTIQIKRQTFSA